MNIATTARRASLDAFVLGGIAPADGPIAIRAAAEPHYMTGQRLRLAREALAILRSRPGERLDVETLAAAMVPRIIDLVASRDVVL